MVALHTAAVCAECNAADSKGLALTVEPLANATIKVDLPDTLKEAILNHGKLGGVREVCYRNVSNCSE